ncbi:hypothetical protein [Shewanella algae]|uniref:hypothetical protein n=1 Tax=Shewanella algae TaxID=38313 RepID=UPI0031F5554F
MKVLLVDDDQSRCDVIRDLLLSNTEVDDQSLYVVHNALQAKDLMRNICFDFLILDVVLPLRDSKPNAKNGLDLLNAIKKRPTIKKPGKILGITAKVDDVSSFRRQFDEHCEVLMEASNRSHSWKSKLVGAINFESVKKISLHTSEKPIVCLSVHGIRTRGAWQQDLQRLIESKVDNVDFQNYKYGYFTIFSFFVPFLRNVQVNRFQKALLDLSKEKHGEEFYIFCHSFGTYIVVRAISNLIKANCNLNVSKIVLAGSVLKSSYDFTEILQKLDVTIINDCGSDDAVLLLSEVFVPNTGMAGRIGFFGVNNNRFSNRFFLGGHSHYFDLETKFMEKNWVPVFSGDGEIQFVDRREDNLLKSEIVEKVCSFIGRFKELAYFSLIGYGLYSYMG